MPEKRGIDRRRVYILNLSSSSTSRQPSTKKTTDVKAGKKREGNITHETFKKKKLQRPRSKRPPEVPSTIPHSYSHAIKRKRKEEKKKKRKTRGGYQILTKLVRSSLIVDEWKGVVEGGGYKRKGGSDGSSIRP